MLTYLHTLMVLFVSAGIISLVLLVVISADMIYYYFHGYKAENTAQNRARKDRVRDRKEAEAAEIGFFADDWLEPYKPGFDNTGELYYRGKHISGKHRFQQMELVDPQADAKIIEITEEF